MAALCRLKDKDVIYFTTAAKKGRNGIKERKNGDVG
jgi:hypothetical protein